MNRATGRLFSMGLIVAWVAALGGIMMLPNVIAMSDAGDFLIRNTVRLALIYWAIAVAHAATLQRRLDRLAWTLGCIAYLIHVSMAFEFAHHWSHTAAFEHVRQAGGFGEGIYINYFFTIAWSADAAWRWIDSAGHEARPQWMRTTIHGFMLFVIVNGAIIFESGLIRWIGSVALLGLACLFWHRMRSGRQDHSQIKEG